MPRPAQQAATAAPTAEHDFATLLQAARPRLWLVARAILSNDADAEDCLQDAAIIGLTKHNAGEFTPGTNFEAWMGQITRYAALNALRKRRPHGRRDDPASRPPPPDADRADPLRDALARLDETARLCLVLRIVGGLPYAAISAIAGIPEGTAASHVHRSQRALRGWLATARSQGDLS
ncbi:MAG: sigma-70 family RNA polymerase sigma factor [Phycisphaerae bacterium]|nr:sigma-70 family RNA polymerase sigma factor [Phycisphaerae bacterium]